MLRVDRLAFYYFIHTFMYALNKVQIIGYLTQNPEIRKTTSDQSVGDLNIVTPYAFKGKDGSVQQGKSFHSVVVWRGLADICGQYLKQGSQVYIAGRLQTDSWEGDDGQKKSKTRIVADEMIMLDSKNPVEGVPADALISESLNRADIIGNLTRDPEIRSTPNGAMVANIGIATNYTWRSKDGENKEVTEFHNVVIWGDLADQTSKYLQKGRKVFVSGRLQTRSWEAPNGGGKRYTTEIVAESVSLLGQPSTDLPQEHSYEPNETASNPVAAGNITEDMVPEISYESDVKPEDLPF